jgi:hypothetical protein
VTITVTAQPLNSPPRFQIQIATPSGQAITAVSLVRSANGSTVATRVQPNPGPSPQVLFDYEAPWETNVVYTATVTYGGTTESYTAAAAVLAPPFPWLIHPLTPSLSMILDQDSFDAMGVTAIGDEVRPEIKNKHRILGAEFQIVTKTGPRGAVSFPLSIATVTPDERAGLIAITRDQTPLLIQVPDSWGWDLETGYYDVGDLGSSRWMQYGGSTRRGFTLPLERVEAPAGSQQAIRTWANVLAQNATWQSLVAGYATWTDVQTDSRR